MLLGVLQRAGHRVLDSPGPKEALEKSLKYPGEIQLLIADILMPKVSGLELSGAILSLRPLIKVLYVSGYADDSFHLDEVARDPLALLRKPVNPGALLQRVREVLDRRMSTYPRSP